jgi:hypothetical protein
MKNLIRGLAIGFIVAGAGGAYALGDPTKGSWTATLQGRDLDGNVLNGAEAFYDTALNITWLANANTNVDNGNGGLMTWAQANSWAATTSFFGIGGWRLPAALPVDPILGLGNPALFTNNGTTDIGQGGTASEMGHLYYVTLGNLGACTPNDAAPQSCAPQALSGLRNTGPFTELQPVLGYWSGTVSPSLPTENAFDFGMEDGAQFNISQGFALYGMAVRSGDVGVVPEPQTYVLMLTGLTALLVVRRRRSR